MRIAQCLIAGWYLLSSTNLPAFALDQLIPQTKTIASADFPCAHHDCGCKTAEQCRHNCCCHPQARQPLVRGAICHLAKESPTTVRVSYLSEARCKGHRDSAQLSLHKLDPHLPLTGVTLLSCAEAKPWPVRQGIRQLGVVSDPPDKIPI